MCPCFAIHSNNNKNNIKGSDFFFGVQFVDLALSSYTYGHGTTGFTALLFAAMYEQLSSKIEHTVLKYEENKERSVRAMSSVTHRQLIKQGKM